jgi:hypothetical protein
MSDDYEAAHAPARPPAPQQSVLYGRAVAAAPTAGQVAAKKGMPQRAVKSSGLSKQRTEPIKKQSQKIVTQGSEQGSDPSQIQP